MSSKVILPTIIQPPIMALNSQAGFLSILFTVENYYKYFYSDFINMWFSDVTNVSLNVIVEKWYEDNYFFDKLKIIYDKDNVVKQCLEENVSINNFDQRCCINNKLFLEPNKTINSIKEMLKSGFYVTGRINEFYVPKRIHTEKNYFKHDFFLDGFDDESKCFRLNGYGTSLKYECVEISYDAFIKGVSTMKKFGILTFLKLKKNYNFHIDVKKINMLLENYLNSSNSFESEEHNPGNKATLQQHYFGTSVYTGLSLKCSNLKENWIDLRIFKLLLELKICMLNRFFVLREVEIIIRDEIIDAYRKIVDKHVVLFNMAIKFNITNNKFLLEKISKNLNSIKFEEFLILEKVNDFIKAKI